MYYADVLFRFAQQYITICPSPNRYEKRYEMADLSDFQNCYQIRLLTRKTTRGCIFRWKGSWVVSTSFHDELLDRPWSDVVFFAPAFKRCWADIPLRRRPL